MPKPSSGPESRLRKALWVLHTEIPRLEGIFQGIEGTAPDWLQVLEHQVLPAVDYEVPFVLMALCGGGSTGKSTLFNTLAGKAFSPSGFKAGMTRRLLICAHREVAGNTLFQEHLKHRLGRNPEPWKSPTQALDPGPPLLIASDTIRRNLVLLDTPDFDTGEGDVLVNRAEAEPALRTSELLCYLFTNAVYNNAANAAFMSRMIGRVGGREAVLVYRVSRVLSDEEALDHCRTVAGHLYPGAPQNPYTGLPRQVLAAYRIHESDEVALGKAAPSLLPLPGMPPFEVFLSGVDTEALKRRVLGAEIEEIRVGAEAKFQGLRRSAAEGILFRKALDQAVALAATRALQLFPRAEAMDVIQELWAETSPLGLRTLRLAGNAISAPVRGVWSLLKRSRILLGSADSSPADWKQAAREAVETGILEAAGHLRSQLLLDRHQLAVEDLPPQEPSNSSLAQAIDEFLAAFSPQDGLPKVDWAPGMSHASAVTPIPESVREAMEALEKRNWEVVTAALRQETGAVCGITPDIREGFREEIVRFRESMGLVGRVREMAFSSLAVLPPMAAVAYVLSTGDPVTGGTIAVHLKAALGLQDLWAVVSMPLATGLNEVDRRQLSEMLAPIINRWFSSQVERLRFLFVNLIAGPLYEALNRHPERDEASFSQIREALDDLR